MSRKCCMKWCTLAMVVMCLGATVALADQSQGLVKWSQPPVLLRTPRALILGWDQVSMVPAPIVADDYLCEDPRPVTDLHWWGSYPQLPLAWRPASGQVPHPVLEDVKAEEDPNMPWSHPGQELWRIVCENYRVEPVGYDVDVDQYLRNNEIVIVDQAFQYNQILSRRSTFTRALAPMFIGSASRRSTTTPHRPTSGAGRPAPISSTTMPSPRTHRRRHLLVGADYRPGRQSWDMAFELTTVPEPSTLVLLAMAPLGCWWPTPGGDGKRKGTS